MSTDKCGRFHLGEAKSKVPRTEKGIMRPSNGFTQRPEQLIESTFSKIVSSSNSSKIINSTACKPESTPTL